MAIRLVICLLLMASVACGEGAGPASPHSSYHKNKMMLYNVKDFGAKGDGTTDDASAIQSALDAVPDSGGTIYIPVTDSGFLIDTTLWVKARTAILGGGYGSLIKQVVGDTCWMIRNADSTSGVEGIVIENLRLDGQKTYTEYSDTKHGDCISLYNVSNSAVRNCWITRTDKDGIAFRESQDFEITGNVLWLIGEDGIAVSGLTSARGLIVQLYRLGYLV